MSNAVDTCALCPKLCRHVCPVAVATSLESATPTSIMGEIMLVNRRFETDNTAHEAVDLCTRCGKCEEFCGVDQPVVSLLDDARTRLQAAPPKWVPPKIVGHSPTVAVVCGDQDWSKPLEGLTSQKMAVLATSDHLGELHRIRTDTRSEVIAAIEKLMQGRTAITSCGSCRKALDDASVPTESITMVSQTLPPLPTWRTCHCMPGPSVNTVVKCCGARSPLINSNPKISNKIAEEVGRRLDGQAIFVPDTRCAAHLKQSGVHAVGPSDPLFEMED